MHDVAWFCFSDISNIISYSFQSIFSWNAWKEIQVFSNWKGKLLVICKHQTRVGSFFLQTVDGMIFSLPSEQVVDSSLQGQSKIESCNLIDGTLWSDFTGYINMHASWHFATKSKMDSFIWIAMPVQLL